MRKGRASALPPARHRGPPLSHMPLDRRRNVVAGATAEGSPKALAASPVRLDRNMKPDAVIPSGSSDEGLGPIVKVHVKRTLVIFSLVPLAAIISVLLGLLVAEWLALLVFPLAYIFVRWGITIPCPGCGCGLASSGYKTWGGCWTVPEPWRSKCVECGFDFSK